MSLTLFGILGLTLLFVATRRHERAERQPVPIRVDRNRTDRHPRR